MLSPASVPSCSWSVESSIAWAMTLAVPGEPVTRRIEPAPADRHRDVGEDPPQPLVGDPARRRAGDVLGRDVAWPVVAGDLDEPELGDVAADRRLGDGEAAPRQALGELLLAADRLGA